MSGAPGGAGATTADATVRPAPAVPSPPPPTLARAALARALSLALAPPSEEGLDYLARLAAGLAIEEGLGAGVAAGVAALATALAEETPLEAMRADHELLFGSDGVCPPYEGAFERDPFRETRQLADVAGFYRAFGADTTGPRADRPDHAACELEFLAFLAVRRLQAAEAGDADAAETCRLAEDAFLEDHVGRFLPALCREVAGIAVVPLYLAAAALGAAWVDAELAARGLVAKPAGERRRRAAVESDELVCGDGCGLAAEQALHRVQSKPKMRQKEDG